MESRPRNWVHIKLIYTAASALKQVNPRLPDVWCSYITIKTACVFCPLESTSPTIKLKAIFYEVVCILTTSEVITTGLFTQYKQKNSEKYDTVKMNYLGITGVPWLAWW